MRGDSGNQGKFKVGIAAAVAALALLGGIASTAPAKPKQAKTTTKRVTVRSNGKEVNADNDFGAVSANGRYVSFESVGRFTQGDSLGTEDVFVHDRKTGTTRRASVKSDGKQVPGGDAADSSISNDGRYVAFLADGALVANDTNGKVDVYVKDMQTGKVRRASVKSDGSELAFDSDHPAISGNGRYVAFDSEGPFVGVDTNNISDVFRHDMKTGKTSRVDVRFDGAQSVMDIYGFGASEDPSISADGNVVAYESTDSPMTPQTDYGFFGDKDVYARNIKLGTTVRVSLKADGSEANATNNQTNQYPAISGNGRFVAFSADGAGPFVPGDTNNLYDVYVKDLKTDGVSRVSLKSNGDESTGASGIDAPASISADGQRIAFESYGQLVPSDTSNVYRDIYVRDRKAKRTIRASITTKRKQVDGYSHQLPSISADGHWVGFSSQGKFTGSDAGVDFDVFERGPLR